MRSALARKPKAWSDFYVGLSESEVTGPGRPSPCWEVVRRVYRGERRVFLPARSGGSGWRLINPAEARDFDLVVFRQGGISAHVGVIAGGPWRMLHLPEARPGTAPMLSCIERFDNGSFMPRLEGVYRYEGGPQPPVPLPDMDDAHVGVVVVPFLNPERAKPVTVAPDQTLAELIDAALPRTSAEQRARMRVMVGRADVPRGEWVEYLPQTWGAAKPRGGLVVAIEPIPAAIPWGKVIALLAITAALAAGQYYLGPALATTAFAHVLGTAAISAALGAAALVAGGLQKQGQDAEKGVFSATGWQNRVRFLENIPDPFGKTRDAPAYGALPYISIGTGEPSVLATWLYTFSTTTTDSDPGDGTLRLSSGTAGGLGTLVIRGDDLDNQGHSHAAQFAAWLADAADLTFKINKRGDPTIVISGTVTTVTTETGYTNLTVSVEQPLISAPVPFADADDIVLSIQSVATGTNAIYLHGLFVDLVGEGVESEPRYGDTPIDKFTDDGDNPVTMETALLSPGDPWPFTSYPHTVIAADPSTMGASFPSDSDTSDWVERAAPRDITALEVFLAWPSGLYNTNDSTGAAESCNVFFQVQYALIGTDDWTDVDWTEEGAQDRKPVYRSMLVEVDRGTYKVRIRKTDRDDRFDKDSSQDTFVWMALQGHRPEVPIACRKPITVTAFRVRSTDQLQGNISAYNRVASRKARYWDKDADGGAGAWVYGETANPAAAILYYLQSGALAVPYDDADIDLDKLAELSEYCDAKGLKYNTPDNTTDRGLYDKLNEAANAGRARIHRFNSKWSVIIDKPGDPIVGHVSPRNGWQISVTTERTPEADGFSVTFLDETSDYATKTRIVPFPGVDLDDVEKPMKITLPYTDPDTIYREAIRLYYQMFELRLPKWTATAAWDHMTYQAGARLVLDDGFVRTRVSALALFVAGNAVTLEEPVTMEVGKSYQLRFRHLPDEGDEDDDSPPVEDVIRDLVTVPGASATVFLSGSGTVPVENDLCIFAEAGETGEEVVVEQIAGGDDLTGTLSLTPYLADLDDAIDALVVPAWDGRVGSIS